MLTEADCEQEVADAIAQFERWIMSPDERRRRVMQALRGHANRHFCLEWTPIAIRIAVAHGAEDVVTGQLFMAREQGLLDRAQWIESKRAPMAKAGGRERDARRRA
jgi:hypothetical protein